MHHVLVASALAAFRQGNLSLARRIAEEHLATSGELPLLHHLIGLIDCRLGRFDSGVEQLRRASDARPGDLPYRIALCRALIDSGRAAEAVVASKQPPGSSAVEIELWRVRAEAAFYAGDRAVEADAWRMITEARPRDPMAWTNLARSLVAQYRFDEAVAAYRSALAISPTVGVRHELGLILERSNRLEELGALLDAALADGVPKKRLADLWALRAHRLGDADEAWRVAEQIDIQSDPFRLNGLKCKIADADGRPAEAFAAAVAMKGSVDRLGEWLGRGHAYRDELGAREKAIASWPKEFSRSSETVRPSPAFLVGFPRSGTTLADIFLRGHPGVRVAEEIPLLEEAALAIGGVRQIPNATAKQLSVGRDVYLSGLEQHIGADFNGLIIDKMPLNMLNLPVIAALFPDARIIFAQRHPCDCVLSCFMQPFVLNKAMASFLDLGDAADFYDAAMGLLIGARDRFGLQIHTLVYEELIADPEAVLRPLIDFLDLEWCEGILDHCATAARRGAIKTPSYDSVSQPISESPSGRWRRYEAELMPVLPVLMPWARRLGYAD